MKKNTRLLAVLLALTILALSLTACASSRKYVAETTTATVSNSAAYDSAPMEEPASTTQETAEFEEMKSENGALSMTTEVTQDDAPEAASTDVASKIIYSADLSAQTTDFDAAIAKLDAQITAFGGFIERGARGAYASRARAGISQTSRRHRHFRPDAGPFADGQ